MEHKLYENKEKQKFKNKEPIDDYIDEQWFLYIKESDKLKDHNIKVFELI